MSLPSADLSLPGNRLGTRVARRIVSPELAPRDKQGDGMPAMKRAKRRDGRVRVANLKTRQLTGQEQKRVKGGISSQKTPLPGGPVPVPYPNALK